MTTKINCDILLETMEEETTMTKEEKIMYGIAKKYGDKHFGSPCPHKVVWQGKCMSCKRKVKFA